MTDIGPKCQCNPGFTGKKCDQNECKDFCKNGGNVFMKCFTIRKRVNVTFCQIVLIRSLLFAILMLVHSL